MTTQEILTICTQFGTARDNQNFNAFAAQHAFVVQNPKAKRNVGKVPAIDMLAAYARGVKEALA